MRVGYAKTDFHVMIVTNLNLCKINERTSGGNIKVECNDSVYALLSGATSHLGCHFTYIPGNYGIKRKNENLRSKENCFWISLAGVVQDKGSL